MGNLVDGLNIKWAKGQREKRKLKGQGRWKNVVGSGHVNFEEPKHLVGFT